MFFFAPLFLPLGTTTTTPTTYERYPQPAYVQEVVQPDVYYVPTQTTYVSAPVVAPVATTYYYPATSYVVQETWPVSPVPVSTTTYTTTTVSNWVTTRNRHWKEKDGTRVKENVLTTEDRNVDGNATRTTQTTTTKSKNGKTTIHYLKKVNDVTVEDTTTDQSNS